MLQRVGQNLAGFSIRRQAHQFYPRLTQGLITLVQQDRHHRRAVQRHADPVTHHAVHRTHDNRAVQIAAPGLNVFNNLRHFATDIDHHPIGGHQRRDARLKADTRMFTQMAVFAVHWQQHIGQEQPVHMFQIGTVCVARHMVFAVGIINDINTDFRQGVDDLQNLAFIPRNGFR